MGRTTLPDPNILMQNLVVYQEDGIINSVYLVLRDKKFISIQPSVGSHFGNEELLIFAGKVAEGIKNYE